MNLSGSLQENILVLMCFDGEALPVLANSVPVDLFDSSIYREIATQALNYYHEFKKPINEHLPDVMEDTLNGKDKKKGDLYKDTLRNLYDFKDDINSEYVLKQLSHFNRGQNLKLGLKEAVTLMASDKVDEAEVALEKYRKKDIELFDPGIRLNDPTKSLRFLTKNEVFFPMGIDALDSLGICPAPKEMLMFVGSAGTGKTWALIHAGKSILLQRKKVLHITLEMSEDKIAQRYMQSLFGISKRKVEKETPFLVTDDMGKLSDFDFGLIKDNPTFADPDIGKQLRKKLTKIRNPNYIIKEFPTGQLTITQLKAYMESLQYHYNFFPDALIIDYADLMAIDSKNLRIDTGRLCKELRGLAVEYNLSLITASQANRVGDGVKILTRNHLAEDYSKVAIADNLITLNQTPDEYQMGLMRLYVDKGRNDRHGDQILLAQNYDMGQFCLDSVRINQDYWPLMEDYAQEFGE